MAVQSSIENLKRGVTRPGPVTPLLAQSLDDGTRIGLSKGRSILADFYSRGMSTEDLQAAIAFYSSTEGRVANRERTRQIARNQALIARWPDVVLKLPDQQVELPPYQHTRAEGAFLLRTPGGRALATLEQSADGLTTRATVAESPIRAIEAAYCDRAVCSPDDHLFFSLLATSIRGDQTSAEQDTFGERASLAVDPQAAAIARMACSGDATAVAAAVRKGADPNALALRKTYWSEGATTPLLWAADCGNMKGIEALLAAGADPNAPDEFSVTPITFAAELKNPRILRLLLDRGGDPNGHTDKATALERAFVAAWYNEADGVPEAKAWANWNQLISAGADINKTVGQHNSLADVAADHRRFDKVDWLLERGWRGDYVYLGRSLSTYLELVEKHSIIPKFADAQKPWVDKVQARLEREGVKFPVPALSQLRRDENGRYIQD